MTLKTDFPFFQVVLAGVPDDLAEGLRQLSSSSSLALLDSVFRFTSGAPCPKESTKATKEQWSEKQILLQKSLQDLIPSNKRSRDEGDAEGSSSKRQKVDVDEDDVPRFTIHSVSTTSPVRKKVNITVHKKSIKFTNPTTGNVEAIVPLSALRRSFILPTRGKQKAHWTVVLLSSDTSEQKVKNNGNNPQIIFGLDAIAPTPLTTTDHTKSKVKMTPKGSDTLPSIEDFLSWLSPAVPILRPSLDVFKSVLSGNTNTPVPGLEAYAGAKSGTLWFFEQGILWGEAKPCEFWAVEDLLGKEGAVRMVSATGRMCSMFITRKSEDDEEDVGEETQFGMIDGREQEGVLQWVKKRRHLFGGGSGAEKEKEVVHSGPMTIMQLGDASDDSDEDFEGSEDSEEERTSSSSGSGGEEQEEEEAAESEEDAEGEDELDEKHHPLMRPGAMPRMSRAAMDMVVEMVEQDTLGGGSRSNAGGSGYESEELDELED